MPPHSPFFTQLLQGCFYKYEFSLFKTIHWFSIELNPIPIKPNSLWPRRQLFLPYFLLLFSSHQTPVLLAFIRSSTMPSPFSPQSFTPAFPQAPQTLYCWFLSYHWSLCSYVISLERVFLIFPFKLAFHHFSFTFSIAIIAIWIYICSLLSVFFHHDINSMRSGALSHSPLHSHDEYIIGNQSKSICYE